MNDSVFLGSRRVCSDNCAKEAKDVQNNGMFDYSMYQDLKVDCDGKGARFPGFAYDHVNLSGRTGYGIAEGCVVDNYSMLRNDPAQMTRDRCRVQLFSRMFHGCPNLKPGIVDPDQEMPIVQGTGSSTLEGTVYACKKTLTEVQTKQFTPLVECTKEIQKAEHIVEPWVRGGDDTRSYVRRQEMLSACGQLGPRRW